MDITTSDGLGAGGNVAEKDEQLSQLDQLNRDLGLFDVGQDSVLPAPIDNDTSGSGVDSLGQPIVDGSIDDDTVGIPGLEEFDSILAETIDPLDTEALNAIDEDIENTLKVVSVADATVATLGEHIETISEQGGINQGDLDEALSIHPGMEEFVRPLYTSTPKFRTKTNYAAGVEALSDGQKALAAGAAAALVALFIKIILIVLRVMKTRAAINQTKYAKALRTPGDMQKYQEAIDHQVNEVTSKSKDHVKYGQELARIMKDKTTFDFDANTLSKKSSLISAALFTQAIRNKYFAMYEIIAGRAINGIDHGKLIELFTNTPKIVEDYAAKLNILLDKFIADFNKDTILDVKDYLVDDKGYKYSTTAGTNTSTGMARQAQLLKQLTVRIDEPKVGGLLDYTRNVIDLTETLKIANSVVPAQKDAAKKVDQLKHLVSALKTSGRADIRDNRTAVLKSLQIQEANFAHACTGIESAASGYVDLLEEIKKSLDDTVKVHQQAFQFSSK